MVAMTGFELFLGICIAGFALLLFIVSIMAYRRTGITRMLLIGIGFAAYSIKGDLILLGLVTENALGLIFDFVIMVFLYLAIGKR